MTNSLLLVCVAIRHYFSANASDKNQKVPSLPFASSVFLAAGGICLLLYLLAGLLLLSFWLLVPPAVAEVYTSTSNSNNVDETAGQQDSPSSCGGSVF
jgi:hypothetical protein